MGHDVRHRRRGAAVGHGSFIPPIRHWRPSWRVRIHLRCSRDTYMASRDRPTTAPHQYVLLVLFGVTGAFAGALGVTALPLFAAAARPAWFAHAVAIAVIFAGFALLVW